MPEFSAADSVFMAQALRLAACGQYTAHPNPMVGCVIVSGDEVVGEGFHEFAGEAHAEINALHAAGARARGATAYVTLEPCAHHGRTPPCAEALISAGIAEVVYALDDPYPDVDGRGQQALRDAGLKVRSGLMGESAAAMLAGFLSRMQRGRPFVRVKIAASLDGRVAMADGNSQWITGPAARSDVQRLRARSGAIMTGIGTVLADDPSLTLRAVSLNTRGRQPVRVVLDSGLRMPLAAEMLALPGRTLLYCCDDANGQPLLEAGAEVVKVGGSDSRVDLLQVLEDLAAREINDVLIEAGPTLAGSFIEQNLVDELVIYQAPHIMGSETLGMFHTPMWAELSDRRNLEITDMRRLGNDMRITARLADES